MAELISPAAEQYALAHTTPLGGLLGQVADWTHSHTEWPGMMAGLPEARLLQAFIVAGGARRVLEIGTFTGLGALAMAEALPADGRVTTLELDPGRVAQARAFAAESPVGERIDVIEGPALETLARLEGPFDLVWIDALKSEYPAYYAAVLPKLSARGLIVADNLFRAGQVLDGQVADEHTNGMRAFTRLVHEDDRVDNVLLTVGDGMLVAWRRPSA